MSNMSKLMRVTCCVTAILLYSVPGFAQTHVGGRVGVSADPDQFVFGGHIETQPVVTDLTFRPNIEVGVGNNTTLVALNFEFAYWIPLKNQWRLYVGAGPAANLYNHRGRGGSNTVGGLNFLAGTQHDNGLFFELKVGAIDSPSLKFNVGYVFR